MSLLDYLRTNSNLATLSNVYISTDIRTGRNSAEIPDDSIMSDRTIPVHQDMPSNRDIPRADLTCTDRSFTDLYKS